MRTGKFQKPRRHPECSQSLRACNPDFTSKWLRKHAAPTDKSERRFLHLFRTGQQVAPGPSQANTVTVTREQNRADLMFQLFDPPRNAVAGHAQPGRCGAKATGPRHLEESPNAFPVGAPAIA